MNRGTILLVEDNPDHAALTQRALHRNNIANDVVLAEDGQAALDFLHDPATELPMLVLLDLKLPKVDGLEVLRRIRLQPRTHRLPVVILTSSDEEADRAVGYDLGANSYIRKPVDFANFLEAVKQIGTYWLMLNLSPP
jgi:two-component system response regulator